MGYSTNFSGVLLFKRPITMHELACLKNILGEDCRDHPEWRAKAPNLYKDNLTFIDLQIVENEECMPIGLEWDGSEKTYDLVEKVNLVIALVRESAPPYLIAFGLTGILDAKDDYNNKWKLFINKDGWAERE